MKFLPLLIVFALATACSGHYIKNRGRDLADIVTLEVETKSVGASVRIGPVQAGLSYKSPQGIAYGLRGGHAGRHHTAGFTTIIFGADYFVSKPMKNLLNEGIPEENKSEQAILPSAATSENIEELKELALQSDSQENITILQQRNKQYRARNPFGTTIPLIRKKRVFKKKSGFAPGYYFTQIDISVGLYFGLRIGINPGELLDFILGWFKIDIYDDDEPFEDPRIQQLKNTPMWKSLDPKSQEKLLKEMRDYK